MHTNSNKTWKNQWVKVEIEIREQREREAFKRIWFLA